MQAVRESPPLEFEEMALRKEDKDWIKRELVAAHLTHKPSRLKILVKEWGLPGCLVAVVITAFVLWNSFTNEMSEFVGRTEKSFETIADTLKTFEDRLKTVEDGLGRVGSQVWPGQLVEAAENPTTATNQQAALEIVETARKLKASIPEDVVRDAGQSFVSASSGDAGAWKTVTALVEYRSYLISLQFPIPQTEMIPESTRFVSNTPPGKSRLQLSHFRKGTSIQKAARLQHIGEPTNPTVNIGTTNLLARGGAISLDTMDIAHVAFVGVEVHYSGGPVILEDVIFVDCRFVFTNANRSRTLASNILVAETVNFAQPT